MPYDGRVYRILVASPSDVDEERAMAVQVIQEWNDLHSYARQVVLLPLRWETHTAPNYGVRPQEVINRAIVDECDLLLGVFWCRIGTPTGEARSGTLEEISRVARAGKPVMLYFSKRGVDPDNLDIDQLKSLQKFKKETYPNALVESCKSVAEFRDKLARQLEIKIRELDASDKTGEPPPLSLQFISVDTGQPWGETRRISVAIPKVLNLRERLDDIEDENFRKAVKRAAANEIWNAGTRAAVLAINNTGSSGIRNVYVEMLIEVPAGSADVTEYNRSRAYSNVFQFNPVTDFEMKLTKLIRGGFAKVDTGWAFSFEWDAIQPQRLRVIEPIPLITAKSSSEITFHAKVYADTFPQPLSLRAKLEIDVQTKEMSFEDLVNLDEIKSGMSRTASTLLTSGTVIGNASATMPSWPLFQAEDNVSGEMPPA
jgi:hypothetical protein